MGMIKRMIRSTSRKILSKIALNGHSQELILNQPAQPGEISQAFHRATKSRVGKMRRKLRSSSGKDTAVAEALLLAAKNYLPPVQFHHVHGQNAQLSSNKSVARRTQSFCQALVFSNRVIMPNERVYIKVLEIAKGWSGTIRFGFTAVDPATLAYKMPKHACPDMTNAGHTWARALADEIVRRNSVIHFSYNKDGLIHYGINNQDCGIFHANVNTNQNLWFIVDIYGLTAAVELIDPRVNNATGEFGDPRSTTLFKSTSIMDDIFGGHRPISGSRSRRKQSRKTSRHTSADIVQGDWPLERSALLDQSRLMSTAVMAQFQHKQQSNQQLPNLNSISLPSAQQNIYSPMPVTQNPMADSRQVLRSRSHQRGEMHDYHQVMTHNNSSIYSSNSVYQPVKGQFNLSSAASAHNLSCTTANSAASSSPLNTTTTSNNAFQVNQCLDLCDRLEDINLNISSNSVGTKQQQRALSRSSKSTNAHNHSPAVAATAEHPHHQSASVQTKHKRSESRSRAKVLNQRVGSSTIKPPHTLPASSSLLSPSSAAKSSSPQTVTTISENHQQSAVSGKENVKPKVRHSIKQKSSIPTNRDSNNNTPPSKDCPICFERPINCVLYQCGHMCTCYECGVKQWKTQSRTCPICRTIIKDVIKTYLS